MKKRNATTSIFSIVETMQRTLEGQGLDSRDVDDRITRNLASLLSASRQSRQEQRSRRRPALALWLTSPAEA